MTTHVTPVSPSARTSRWRDETHRRWPDATIRGDGPNADFIKCPWVPRVVYLTSTEAQTRQMRQRLVDQGCVPGCEPQQHKVESWLIELPRRWPVRHPSATPPSQTRRAPSARGRT